MYHPRMGNLHACLAVAVLPLAACGSDHAKTDGGVMFMDAGPDAKVFMDAPPPSYDFTCSGNTAPTTATAEVTLSGTVTQVSLGGSGPSFNSLAGADVSACDATAADCTGPDRFDTATSAGDGTFSLGPIDTMDVPLDAYLVMTEDTSRTTYVYPAAPFTADQPGIPVLTFATSLEQFFGVLGCEQTAAQGMIAVAVTDCTNTPITDTANIRLTIDGNTVADNYVDLGTLNANAAGTFLICGLTPGDAVNVGGEWNAMALRPHAVRVVAAATTATILRPGY